MSVKPLKCFLLGQGLTLPFGHLGSRWPWLMKESDSVNKRTCVQSVLGLRETCPKLQVRELALCAGNFYWCNSKYAWEKITCSFLSVLPDREQVGHHSPSLTLYYLWPPSGRAAEAACVPVTEPWTQKKPTNLCTNTPPRLLNTTALPNPGLP